MARRKREKLFVCPICKRNFTWNEMCEHLEHAGEDHLDLFNDLDVTRNDAYMIAEEDWIIDNCEEKR